MKRGKEPEGTDEGLLTEASGLEKKRGLQSERGEQTQCFLTPYTETDHRAYSLWSKRNSLPSLDDWRYGGGGY